MPIRLTTSIALLCGAIGPVFADTSTAVTDAPSAGPTTATLSVSSPHPGDRVSTASGLLAAKATDSSAGSVSGTIAAGRSGSSRDGNVSQSALPPASVDSATLFQARTPVPLGGRAYEDAAERWAQTGDAPVLVGTNGAVMYAYGQSHPSVTCAPLRICVINLMAHEHITNMSIGDSVRWLVQSADAGAGNEVTPVVITKPTEPNLVTNLAITTDAGRVYYLTLHSDQRRYVPQIGFYDPQQIVVRLEQQRAVADQKVAAHQDTIIDNLGSVDPATLDFSFTCKADNHAAEHWLPLRVFAGGGHTYLQMPDTMAFGDAPALFNLVEIGHHTQTELINSRLLHGYYVIDGLPSRFKLLVGTGKAARTVTCSHG
jgi:P-type conjugative transfer protein TrbG